MVGAIKSCGARAASQASAPVGGGKLSVSCNICREDRCKFRVSAIAALSPQGGVTQLIVQGWSVDSVTPEAAHQQARYRHGVE